MKSIYLLLLLFQTLIFAQGKSATAGEPGVPNGKISRETAVAYLKKAEQYKFTQVDSAFTYALKAHAAAKAFDDKKLTAESAEVLGDLYVAKGKFEVAKGYFSQAVSYWKANDRSYRYCNNMMLLGNIYFVENNYVQAFEHFYEALEISERKKYKDLIAHLNNNMGVVYSAVGDYKEAAKYFRVTQNAFLEQGHKIAAAYALVNLSDNLIMLGKEQEAMKNYRKVFDELTKNGVWEDVVFAHKAIASMYVRTKKYEDAEPYLVKAIKIIDENNKSTAGYRGANFIEMATVYRDAATVYNYKNQLDIALEYAKKSLDISTANSYKQLIYSTAEILSEIYEKKGMTDQALRYSNQHIKTFKEFLEETNTEKVSKVIIKSQLENAYKKKEIEALKKSEKAKRNELIYLGISVFTILVSIIMVLLFRNQKAKLSRMTLTKEKLELEKTSLNHDLEYKRKEIASNMMYLAQKSEFIASIAQKLKALDFEGNKEQQKTIQQLIVELNQNTSNKIWEEFEVRFKEVHSAFYENLFKLYPDLTPNEIKICAFLRLNMSTKDISGITHQSVKSINVARSRLRKKLDIESDENLISFLNQL